MFFEEELMTRSAVSRAWRAGHNVGPLQGANLPLICQELGGLLEIQDRHSRLSQRSGAVLVNGAARLYKAEADSILEDLAALTQRMMLKEKREEVSDPAAPAPTDAAPGADGGGSGTHQEPTSAGALRTSGSARPRRDEKKVKRRSRKRVAASTPDNRAERVSRNRKSKKKRGTGTPQETGTVMPLRYAELVEGSAARRRDVAVQTELFDPTLPFAVMNIYDTYGSLVPSKIILSSVNPAVRDL